MAKKNTWVKGNMPFFKDREGTICLNIFRNIDERGKKSINNAFIFFRNRYKNKRILYLSETECKKLLKILKRKPRIIKTK